MSAPKSKFQRFWQLFVTPATFLFFGVILPAITLVVELTTNMCADTLQIDPVPTIWHALAIGAVPVVLGAWGFARRRDAANGVGWRIGIGVVTGISLIYAIPFAPIVPLALIAAFFGIGFLPLAPLGSFVVGLVVLYKTGKEAGWKGFWGSAGVVGAVAFLTILALPTIKLDRALAQIEKNPSDTDVEILETLRDIDSNMLANRLCEYRRTATPNPISPFSNLLDENYQVARPDLYWRVTGESCDHGFWTRGMRFVPRDAREQQPGLSIVSSRVDSSVDTVAATGYTEWLYEVRNASNWQREADFIVQLPPGAVVSRVTLWVHGEPREATFAGRGQAEQAYQAVVNRSRDPILVTSVAPDRIRVRMFPVPSGATMKARIGISQPLELERDGHARMQFPHVIDGNVEVATDHAVWVEARHPISTAQLDGFVEAQTDQDVYLVRGEVDAADLGEFEVDMERQPSSQVYAQDGDQFVVQEAGTLAPESLGHLTVVLDGGVHMAEVEGLAEAFDVVKADTITLIVAGDEPIVVFEEMAAGPARGAIRDFFDAFEFVGGRDNTPALEEALKRRRPNSTIVWIHAGQRVGLGTPFFVPERDNWSVHELQVDGNRDVNVDEMHALGVLIGIPRRDDPATDLERWFEARSTSVWTTRRRFTDAIPMHGKETSRHLARIAANERVFELMRAGEHTEAVEVASRYQIVTPVSAAIVLETQAQYDEFGLERASGEGVPSIPEPHEWALIIIAVAMLGGALLKSRREQLQGAF